MESENKLQSKCFQWAWNYLPETRGLLCYNLNNSRNKIDGQMNKALGLIKGRSDMVLYWNASAHFLEFKTDIGKQSADQIEWQSKVLSQGFTYDVIRSQEQFEIIINKYIHK